MGSDEQRPLSGLRARLAEPDGARLAAFVSIPRIEVVQIIGYCGYDIVILDGEHGVFDAADLPGLVAIAHGVGLDVVVRVPELRAQVIAAALDAGADGVLVPHVRDADQAAQAVAACRFPPVGGRSVHGAVAAAHYGARPDYLRSADAQVACIVMCEDADALADIEAIAAVPGVDAVFVGPYDLSASLGHVGEPEHPVVVEAVARVVAATGAHGLATGVMSARPEASSDWFDAGCRFVVAGVDTAMLRQGVMATVTATGVRRSS